MPGLPQPAAILEFLWERLQSRQVVMQLWVATEGNL